MLLYSIQTVISETHVFIIAMYISYLCIHYIYVYILIDGILIIEINANESHIAFCLALSFIGSIWLKENNPLT